MQNVIGATYIKERDVEGLRTRTRKANMMLKKTFDGDSRR